jgi:predicted transcriptional regulator of viral defense system
MHVVDMADAAVSWIASQQLGLITVEQLRLAGLGRGAVRRRVPAGRLHRVHRGVYLVGHAAPHPDVPLLAALLACGERVYLSHVSALALWELARAPTTPRSR